MQTPSAFFSFSVICKKVIRDFKVFNDPNDLKDFNVVRAAPQAAA